MGSERIATAASHLAIWTWHGLVALGWVVIAALVALVFLTYLGIVDASFHLAGPHGVGQHLDIVAHGIATGAG